MIYDFEKGPICIQLIQSVLDNSGNIYAADHLHENSLRHDISAQMKILQCFRVRYILKYRCIKAKLLDMIIRILLTIKISFTWYLQNNYWLSIEWESFIERRIFVDLIKQKSNGVIIGVVEDTQP